MEYPEHLFQKREPKPYLPLDETEAIYVDSPDTLLEMLSELKQAKEIAVDLEHHDQRSYIGFVCLMQISTREKDWIVDTLELRGELQILNEVFADPEIIKVGASDTQSHTVLLIASRFSTALKWTSFGYKEISDYTLWDCLTRTGQLEHLGFKVMD
jgi:hypothetical protein